MKKSRPSGSSRKSSGSSGGSKRPSRGSMFSSRSTGSKKKTSSRKSIFSRKKESSSSFTKPHRDPEQKNRKESSSSFTKPARDPEQKNRFVKPPHNPGTKYRDQNDDNYPVDNSDNYEQSQTTTRSSSPGCLGSISGTIKLVAVLFFVVVIVVFLKCGC